MKGTKRREITDVAITHQSKRRTLEHMPTAGRGGGKTIPKLTGKSGGTGRVG